MPLYDFRCKTCQNVDKNIVAAPDEYPSCTECGGETEHYWTESGSIHGDEIKPFWCPVSDRMISSRTEWQKVMRENQLQCVGDRPRRKDLERGTHKTRMI